MSITLGSLPDQSTMIENILEEYTVVTPNDFLEGMEWYPRAYTTCVNLADKRYSVEQIAGVMAVLSPGMIWEGNESAPRKLLEEHYAGIRWYDWQGITGYPKNLEKAERILDEDFDALKGNKVVSFYNNILGDRDNYVTVDRWAVRVALGNEKIPGNQAVPSGKKCYNKIADAYKGVSEIVEIPVREVQAVTWSSLRNRNNKRVRGVVNV